MISAALWRNRLGRIFVWLRCLMRNGFKNADSDDITMLVSGCVAMLAFCTLVAVWFLAASAPECGRNCSTEFSSINR